MSRQIGTIGIRHEDKNKWERRCALTPYHIRELCQNQNVRVIIEPSTRRAFKDDEFTGAGAELNADLSEANVVFGVKEIPVSHLKINSAFVFFSHVIKGQDYNMPMLRHILEEKVTLIDYEKITDEKGFRLVAFGRHAGLAGAIDSLWALGKRYEVLGLRTPLAAIRRAHEYLTLNDAKTHLAEVGEMIRKQGLPEGAEPLVIGVTGSGRVAGGALEIIKALGATVLSPTQLLTGDFKDLDPSRTVFVVNFDVESFVGRNDGKPPVEADYYKNPENYHSVFENYAPMLRLLINGIYWDERYPHLLPRESLQRLRADSSATLEVLGDISCDIDGSIAATRKATEVDEPVYTYDAESHEIRDGLDGEGLVVMAVDNLPCELPLDASQAFGDALLPFVKQMSQTDFSVPFEELALPPEIKRAVITHGGELTPDYCYLKDSVENQEHFMAAKGELL